jgi:circadian clock protein KaiC
MDKNSTKKKSSAPQKKFPKTPTGITGLDEITEGGLPKARPTLVCGGPGCGKTLLSVEFIVRGATQFDEPGVFMAFEEKAEELQANVVSLGFDMDKLQREKKVKLDYIHIDRSEIEETGEYDLEGLFIRLGFAIDSIGAKRVVLDTIENLFSNLTNEAVIRSELRRLFQWLKDRKVTAIITAEKGNGYLTRHGLEEYVSDCVILLDNRVANQITTRLLRIVKYRGSTHGTNEYPFLIDEEGFWMMPVTSLRLNRDVSSSRVSSGIPSLDKMLEAKGFYSGSSILLSGSAGTGKTSMAVYFANEACNKKKRCVYFAFEESPMQIVRNMKSINIHLQQHIDKGLLQFHSARPTLNGLEMHLLTIHKVVRKFRPSVVILDPITNLVTVGTMSEVKSMLIRLIDFLQGEQITIMFTALTVQNPFIEQTDEGISSLVDAWIMLRDMEANGERNRGLYIMKSRGMGHSKKVREFIISSDGLELVDVYRGPEGVLIGSAREARAIEEQKENALRKNAREHMERELNRKQAVLQAKIATLTQEFDSLQDQMNRSFIEDELKSGITQQNKAQLMRE